MCTYVCMFVCMYVCRYILSYCIFCRYSQRHVNLCLWNQHLCWTSECCLSDHWRQTWFRQVPGFEIYVPDQYPPTNMSHILMLRTFSIQLFTSICSDTLGGCRVGSSAWSPKETLAFCRTRMKKCESRWQDPWGQLWIWNIFDGHDFGAHSGPLSSKNQAGLTQTHRLSILYLPVLDLQLASNICQSKYLHSLYCMCVIYIYIYKCFCVCTKTAFEMLIPIPAMLRNPLSSSLSGRLSLDQCRAYCGWLGQRGLKRKQSTCVTRCLSSYVYIWIYLEWFQQFFLMCSSHIATSTAQTRERHCDLSWSQPHFDWWT